MRILIWWRHQMETFFALLTLCLGNSPVTGEFPSQRPVTRSVDVFFELRLNRRLSKPSRRRWFETPSRSLWRHCNEHSKTGLGLHLVSPVLIVKNMTDISVEKYIFCYLRYCSVCINVAPCVTRASIPISSHGLPSILKCTWHSATAL